MSLAVLISGGLDSAILLGQALHQGVTIYPLYLRCGLAWESIELLHLRKFLVALASPKLQPLVNLDQPIADVYGTHWSITGKDVPADDAPDEAVFLPGRNLLLLTKPLLWCHLRQIPALALGSLGTNPFPDATPTFFRSLQDLVNRAVEGEVEIRLPFGNMTKRDVMHLGRALPLELTYSCIQPQGELHCGRCNKCAERQHAFTDAGMRDPTQYQHGLY